MPTAALTKKSQLFYLIELIPDSKKKQAEIFLKTLIPENKLRKISTKESFNEWLEKRPFSEPLTIEEERNLDESLRELSRGEIISFEEIKKRKAKNRKK